MGWIGNIFNFRIAFRERNVIKPCRVENGVLHSFNFRKPYVIGDESYRRLKIELFSPTGIEIWDGNTSYDPETFWKRGLDGLYMGDDVEICNGVIPKWSVYFINGYGEIVSDRLKIVWKQSNRVEKSGD